MRNTPETINFKESLALLTMVMELYNITRAEAEKLVTYSNNLQNNLAINLGASLFNKHFQGKGGLASKTVDIVGGMIGAAPFSPLITTPLTHIAKSIAERYEAKNPQALAKFARRIGVNNLNDFTRELNRRYVEARLDHILNCRLVEEQAEKDAKILLESLMSFSEENYDEKLNQAAYSLLPLDLVSQNGVFDQTIEKILAKTIPNYSANKTPVKKLLNDRKTVLLDAQKSLELAVANSPFKRVGEVSEGIGVKTLLKIFSPQTPAFEARKTIETLCQKTNQLLSQPSSENILGNNSQTILAHLESIENIAFPNGYFDICQKVKSLREAINNAAEIDEKRQEIFSTTRIIKTPSFEELKRVLFSEEKEEEKVESSQTLAEFYYEIEGQNNDDWMFVSTEEEPAEQPKTLDSNWWRLKIRNIIDYQPGSAKHQLSVNLTDSVKKFFHSFEKNSLDEIGEKICSTIDNIVIADESRFAYLRKNRKQLNISFPVDEADQMVYLLVFGEKESDQKEFEKLEKKFFEPTTHTSIKRARPLSFSKEKEIPKLSSFH